MRFLSPFTNFLFHWAYVFVGEILCGETDEPFDTESKQLNKLVQL